MPFGEQYRDSTRKIKTTSETNWKSIGELARALVDLQAKKVAENVED